MYIGIQSFYDIPVHINVLTKRFFLFDPKYLISAIELKPVFWISKYKNTLQVIKLTHASALFYSNSFFFFFFIQIPSSAVEMPGSADISGLNVQFGALDFGSEAGSGTVEMAQTELASEQAPAQAPAPAPLTVPTAVPTQQPQSSLFSKPGSMRWVYASCFEAHVGLFLW